MHLENWTFVSYLVTMVVECICPWGYYTIHAQHISQLCKPNWNGSPPKDLFGSPFYRTPTLSLTFQQILYSSSRCHCRSVWLIHFKFLRAIEWILFTLACCILLKWKDRGRSTVNTVPSSYLLNNPILWLSCLLKHIARCKVLNF